MAFDVVSNPEFLREGSGRSDFMHPDRVILGSESPALPSAWRTFYLPVALHIMVTNLRTAEMIKYASNAFLATRISFINEMADLRRTGRGCHRGLVRMGSDRRIGHHFLQAGRAGAAVASPKTSRRWCTWPICTAPTRNCCAP